MATAKERVPKTKSKAKIKGTAHSKAAVVKPQTKAKAASQLRDPVSTKNLGQQRFQELLEAAPDGILEVDQNGHIQLANAAVEQMFGYTRAEVAKHPWRFWCHQALRPQHHTHRANLGPSDHPPHGHRPGTAGGAQGRIHGSRWRSA